MIIGGMDDFNTHLSIFLSFLGDIQFTYFSHIKKASPKAN
jgi:hypothetical protein